jgi:polyisoprenyl-phosphate glycosyltransferase
VQDLSSERPLLSVVAPMFNEEANVEPFVAAIEAVMVGHALDYELVLVDDGSSDRTWARICLQQARNPRVRGLCLSRNFGHQNALFAGLHHARGRAVVSMDGDLQHPPAVIPFLLQQWQAGYQVVTTVRSDSSDTSLLKRASSRAFYRLFSRLTGVPMSAGSSDFRLVDARVLQAMLKMRDPDLFLRGMVSWLGFRSISLPFQANARDNGRSKYTFGRMLRFSAGALVAFSMTPLKLGIWLGFITSGLAFVELGYILVQYFRGNTVVGWASVMTVMSLMFGILFILLGVVGLYLGKVYEVLKGRQPYVIGDRVGFGDAQHR